MKNIYKNDKTKENQLMKFYFLLKDDKNKLMQTFSKFSQQDKNDLMHHLVWSKNAEVDDIQNLINIGAKLKDDSINAFYLACVHKKVDIVECFLNNGFKKQLDLDRGFKSACTKEIKLADLLLSHGADMNYDNNISFINACRCDKYEMVEFLIKKGMDVNVDDGSALIHACSNNYINLAKLLLKNNANVHVQNEKALAFALRNENANMVQLLENYGAKKENIKHNFQKGIYTIEQIKASGIEKDLIKLQLSLQRILGSAEDDLKAPQLIPAHKNFKFEKFLHVHVFQKLNADNVENESNQLITKLKCK